VTRSRGPAEELADIARQTRAQLERIRESRWAGFAAPKPATSAAAPPPRKTVVRPSTAPATLSHAPHPAEAPLPWDSLDAVAAAVAACTKCPLHATRTRTVPGEGNPRARLMFVGEAPGADEDAQGRPFVGRAGQLLDKMIVAMGLSRGEVFIANVLKCRPPGNRDPQPLEAEACLPFLHAQLALVRPEVICSLGKHSAQALLGSKDPIGRLRGRFFQYRGVPLFPTFHPSYLLRSPGEKVTAWKDLQIVMKRLGLPAPAQNPDPDVWGLR
jgi:DNA polymerase